MSVIKVRHQKEFTTLSNQVLQASGLSMEALGLWGHCMSRPETWTFHVTQLSNHFNVSTKKIYRVLKEMLAKGYAFRGQKKGIKEGSLAKNKHVFLGIEYIFFPHKITDEERKELESEYSVTDFKKPVTTNQESPTPIQESFEVAHFGHAQESHLKKKEGNSTGNSKYIYKNKDLSPPKSEPPPEAVELGDLLFEKIKENNPNHKQPRLLAWAAEFEKLLRIDKRDYVEARLLIHWAMQDKFWKTVILSAGKFRENYDKLLIKMKANEEKDRVQRNRAFAIESKNKYEKNMHGMHFDDKFVYNKHNSKEIPFNLPEDQFRHALFQIFGGNYVPIS